MLKKFLFVMVTLLIVTSYLTLPISVVCPNRSLLHGVFYSASILMMWFVVPLASILYSCLNLYTQIFIILELEIGTLADPDILIRAALAMLPILPFIGMFFVKKKPNLYRLFVYLPLLISIVLTLFTNIVPSFIIVLSDFFIIKDLVYLIFAIILDIKMRKERARML